MATPYQEGFRARLAGESIHSNPYATFTKAASEWEEGWQEQDQHLNDRDEALAGLY